VYLLFQFPVGLVVEAMKEKGSKVGTLCFSMAAWYLVELLAMAKACVVEVYNSLKTIFVAAGWDHGDPPDNLTTSNTPFNFKR
jgi:hypothetical protein